MEEKNIATVEDMKQITRGLVEMIDNLEQRIAQLEKQVNTNA